MSEGFDSVECLPGAQLFASLAMDVGETERGVSAANVFIVHVKQRGGEQP
jgi:hypothetical protein